SWLIVPYMSLDLFFVAAPFLCGDAAELRALRRRMTLVIVAAGAVFLLLPLRFAFPRPHPADWTAPIFAVLHGFDRPYNLFPSLHIAILTILAATYRRHSRGILNVLAQIWFVLIALSAVLTYQHHVVDVAGGFVLALISDYAIPEHEVVVQRAATPRIGALYAAGAALLAAAGGWTGWGAAPMQFTIHGVEVPVLQFVSAGLLWAAVALSIVAGAYLRIVPGLTRNHAGRLPASARVLLAPWLAGQHLSRIHYARQCRPWDEVVPNVWIGRRLSDREAASAVAQGVRAVLDLSGELSESAPFLALTYLNLPVLDLTAPTPAQLRTAADFISAHRRSGIVYVHCKIGYSRSAAVVGAWLLESGLAATPEDAVARMRAVRPTLVVRSEAWRALSATMLRLAPARS
ncbi:MAG TPA: phosphatase PAP2/dual specificity phosphatase family protein, partial [Vicinamibacterales bacterium]|nr:phosphatase PAP2/dual specificity phosphatase family protein [Vicinamibacterales bacterium]